ncbi:MAG TPA: hypothetical protein VEK83_11575 [Gemmatimonadales bacterium]|nr:hypothetical protein [Gemmatimonadales bacterium]
MRKSVIKSTYRRQHMSARIPSRNSLAAIVAAPLLVGVGSLATSGAAFAACTGPGAPTTTETKCLAAVQIPGNPLRSYDISWVNPHRAEYYLADRSNASIDIIDTQHLAFTRKLGGFVGVKLNANGTVNNDISGPDGVVTHGRWLYAGDGDSTLKVFDLDAPDASALKDTKSTRRGGDAGDPTRVDEMALTTDGELLLTVNNAAEPPFATLFEANGDRSFSSVREVTRITISATLFPDTPGIEQPAWDPKTKRFYVSVPNLGKPGGCKDAGGNTITCDGGLMVIDPETVTPGTFVLGAFDPAKNSGVIPLSNCGPNGATVGPHDNLLLGCTPANNATNDSTLVINATTKHFSHVNGIVGSDEVWFNKGDGRYYTGSNRNCRTTAPCPTAPTQAAVLGVIDATSVLIETVPQSSGSHSVAADSMRNLIFVPQSAPVRIVGAGGDTTTVGEQICGSTNGCIGVYVHDVDRDRDDHDRNDHDH